MIKKFLGIFTAISAIIWIAFFLNGVDQGKYFFILLIVSVVNLLLIIKTKFWKENTGQKEELKIIRLLCILLNIVLFFVLFKMMKTEFDLDDSDDIYITILMLLAILAPLFYLLSIKKDYR